MCVFAYLFALDAPFVSCREMRKSGLRLQVCVCVCVFMCVCQTDRVWPC